MLFNWDVSGIPKSFWGQLFEPSARGICVLTVQNMVPDMVQIDPILSVCLSVCPFAPLFSDPLLEQVDGRTTQFSEKSRSKTGSRAAHDAERDPNSDWPPCRGRCTLLKWRLRRAPLFGLFGWWRDAVGDLHLWRHLPPRVPFHRSIRILALDLGSPLRGQ